MTDLSEMKVGDRLPELRFGPITRATLALYAGASGDHNPIHIDSDFAKTAGFDDVFAHGMLTMAELGRLVSVWSGIERVRSISTKFSAITHVADEIVCSGEIIKEEVVSGERILTVKIQARTSPETQTAIGETTVVAD
ncbi:MAG: MaoC/PaaZ C-terminal domain-containing protein [Parvibaculaceae bacterium]